MPLKLFTTLFFLVLSLQLSAQQSHRGSMVDKTNAEYEKKVYKLRSLDSVQYKVAVSTNKYTYDKIFISNGSDSLCIGYWYGYKVSVIDNRFLVVTHGVRLGSDQSQRMTIILAINGGHFVQSFSFQSYYREHVLDWGNPSPSHKLKTIEYTLDSVHYRITNEAGYHIRAHVTIKKYATDDISRNYSSNSTVDLKFDNSLKVFYQERFNLNDYYNLYSDLSNAGSELSKSMVHLNGSYHQVKLGETNYIFVKGKWYIKDDNTLFPVVERFDCKTLSGKPDIDSVRQND
jgi:hypothetical protein